MAQPGDLPSLLLRLLATDGPLASRELQSLVGKSQPTISRALQAVRAEVVTLGAGRSGLYAIQESILGRPGQQPLYWVSRTGQMRAALSLYEIPGAVLLGDSSGRSTLPMLPAAGAALHSALDREAESIAESLPAGSSAGGEQASWSRLSTCGRVSAGLRSTAAGMAGRIGAEIARR